MRLSVKGTALEVVCKIEIFLNGHVGIDRRLLGKITDELFDSDSAFSRSVRAEKSNCLALPYLNAYVIDCTVRAVIFR